MNRLLVVDDDPDVRDLLDLTLSVTGWPIDSAGNGMAALVRCRRGDIDGVLLDLDMPGMDGLATLAALRADPATAALPVVFLTAAVDREAVLLAAGALAVLTKPFDPLALGDELAGLFGWATAA